MNHAIAKRRTSKSTTSWAIAISTAQYDKLRAMVDLHKSTNKKLLEALIDHAASLDTNSQAALIRGDLNSR